MGLLLPPQERKRIQQLNRTPVIRRARRHLLAVFLFLFGVLFWMLALLSPQFTGWIWQSAAEEASPAHGLLAGYLRWYWLLLLSSGVTFAASVVLIAFYLTRAVRGSVAAARVWKETVVPRLEEIDGWDMVNGEEASYHRGLAMEEGSKYASPALAYFLCAFLCFLTALAGGEMLVTTYRFPFQAQSDLAQMESGSLQAAEVWISPKTRPARLPGPYSGGQPTLVTRCGLLASGTDPWVTVYVPDALGFSPNPDRLYDETRTIAWNWENAQRYLVRYTSELHLVAEIVPISPAGGG